ncbi:hypothetical protein COCSUDRAFT_59342 [Coccomyxa subellipsoidea C-169]|uniref:Uncharacterized protein n=1 Tax=Coccomyxa subellipsoidea (strain C-169) TaxID=574566 RepID=I0Z865_COCSC|nr:hypothetical protein COCSUDRAFT_59342 [Coccomyxa subellipsoidea C-169]EIE26834.1 hypothetical protein COCSUDRAFT_59342 [Coccomyxa subellipsoidea C-169]|eukprot:XP_005651378.1 hypothetical protein COCSUDRAFT_59342 [Coccomyxa subellipsoidea C-169]
MLTGDKQGLPDYRSPRPTRSPSTQGYGRTRSHAEGSTPRRRSLTPTGSMKDSLPPPPPSQSMLDAPAVQPDTSAVSEQSGYWALAPARDQAAHRLGAYALNKYGAQRALQRNGELVSRQLMVGVQLLDPRMRSAALELTDGASSSIGPVSLPRPQPMRPHRIDASASQGPLPQAERSTLAKVREFVLGL